MKVNCLIHNGNKRGMAVPIVLAVMLILITLSFSMFFIARQGRQQISSIQIETMLLNTAEAILDKVVAHLKKASWEKRWYKETGHGLGGTDVAASGGESGVLTMPKEDFGYENVHYYFFIEDVREHVTDVGAMEDRVVPHLANLFVQAKYQNYTKSLQCELLFRESSALQPTRVIRMNYRLLDNPENTNLSSSEGEDLRKRGRKKTEEAKKKRRANSGTNDVISEQMRKKLEDTKVKEGPEAQEIVDNPGDNNLDNPSEAEKYRRKREFVEEAKNVYHEYEIAQYLKVHDSSAPDPDPPDHADAENNLIDALKEARTITSSASERDKCTAECLYDLGIVYERWARVSKGPAIQPSPAPTVCLFADTGFKVFLGTDRPASLGTAPSVANDTNGSYSEKTYYLKLAESCFSTIMTTYKTSQMAPKAIIELAGIEYQLSARWGKQYAARKATKVMDVLDQRINNNYYPYHFKLYGEDFELETTSGEVRKHITSYRVAFSSRIEKNAGGKQKEVFILDFNSEMKPIGRPLNISNHESDDEYPIFSPDGKFIAFQSDRDGNYEIYLARTDGTGSLVNVSRLPGRDEFPVFSPDGRFIAFESSLLGNVEVYVVKINGLDEPINISNQLGRDGQPTFFYVEEKIAYFSEINAGLDIYCKQIGGNSSPEKVLNIPFRNENPVIVPPEGERIAYVVQEPDNWEIYITDIEGTGEPKNISCHPATDYSPRFSSDGKLVAFRSERTGKFEIFVKNLEDDNEPVNVSLQGGTAFDPSFSPDGRWIAFHQVGGESYIVRVDGSSNPIRIMEGSTGPPVFSPLIY